MIELVDGAIYSIEEDDLSQEMLEELCEEEHGNDVICVIGKDESRIYINAEDVKKNRIDEGCYAVVKENFNDRLSEHIDDYRKRILQKPEKTLGVLIRGTDYAAVQPKGHAVQAMPEQVIEKIRELPKEEWDFEKIFVATEDAKALKKMQEAFGDKVKYVDQKRFVLQKGEYLSDQKEKDAWKQGDGWRYGADYLCAMVLLSECRFFLASGRCSKVSLVDRLAQGRHLQSYVFDLGLYGS